MAYGAKAAKQPGEDTNSGSWALKALKSLLGFDPVPIIEAMQTQIPETAQKMKDGIDSLTQSMRNIDARLAAIEHHLRINSSAEKDIDERRTGLNGTREPSERPRIAHSPVGSETGSGS